jgi:hypothetical protein
VSVDSPLAEMAQLRLSALNPHTDSIVLEDPAPNAAACSVLT